MNITPPNIMPDSTVDIFHISIERHLLEGSSIDRELK